MRVMYGFAAMCLWPAAALATSQSASVQEVLALNDRLEAAIARSDADAIGQFFAKEFRLQNSANRVLTGEQVLEQFRTGATRFSDYSRSIEAAYASGDVVVLMGAERVRPKGGTVVTRRFTSVWQRTGAEWRQIARQSTNVPAAP